MGRSEPGTGDCSEPGSTSIRITAAAAAATAATWKYRLKGITREVDGRSGLPAAESPGIRGSSATVPSGRRRSSPLARILSSCPAYFANICSQSAHVETCSRTFSRRSAPSKPCSRSRQSSSLMWRVKALAPHRLAICHPVRRIHRIWADFHTINRFRVIVQLAPGF